MRSTSDEHYVIDLCDHLLERQAHRQWRFDFLLGDAGKNGRRTRLPVDAYYPNLNLVIEIMECQHSTPIAFFDKPDRLTVSGVHRGEQRRLYDQRRSEVLPAHGITLVPLSVSLFRTIGGRGKRLMRDRPSDERVLRAQLSAFL